MSRYHSYDRREAESRVRSLSRQERRSRQRREEREIWDELITEQLTLERSRARPVVKQRRRREKTQPRTTEEIGEAALQRAKDTFTEFLVGELQRLNSFVDKGLHEDSIHDLACPVCQLAYARCSGKTTTRLPEVIKTWTRQAVRMLGERADEEIAKFLVASMMLVRITARDVLRTARPETRSAVARAMRRVRDRRREKRREQRGEET